MTITPEKEKLFYGFSDEEIKRYSRQIILPEVGGRGQKKLKSSSLLIIGAGGLGSPASIYLAAAGVGRIGMVDSDCVDISNLQRQILHGVGDLGRAKVESARDALFSINPDVEFIPINTRLDSKNALEVLKNYDVIIDGSDNFPARYLLNDACFFLKKPLCHGAVFRFEGQATTIIPEKGPCYRCLFDTPPPPDMVPSCQEAGVIGVLPGIIGLIQATEALKILLGKGTTLSGALLLFDAMKMEFKKIRVEKNPQCKLCGKKPQIKELIDYDQFCGGG